MNKTQQGMMGLLMLCLAFVLGGAEECGGGSGEAGCTSDADCRGDRVCDDGECVADEDPDECICPAIEAPVCGADGRTYGNSCQADCEDVEIEHEGRCSEDCEPVACRLFCDDGFKVGEDGCEICECNEPDPESCACPAVEEPVCGEDGETYGNSCEAECVNVDIAYEGRCRNECTPVACDLFCEFGFQTGEDGCEVCECNEGPDPCSCDDVYEPVCGENGQTYGNSCESECQGVGIAHEGECRGECAPVLCDLFCEFGFRVDEDGCEVCECNPEPEICSCLDVYEPVCGVDGETYGNGCEAECVQVEIAYDGECEMRECDSNADCEDGWSCFPECHTCEPPCDVDCFQYDPVCGEDGQTYGCGEISAWCNGVDVAYEGECRDR